MSSTGSESSPERGQPRRWLVVGLGNPGEEYENTPHNLGFMVVDRLAQRNGGIRVARWECQSLVGEGWFGRERVLLAKPQTYMNRSGPAVRSLAEKHSLAAADLILVHDELALAWTGLRIRPKGSSAGHNGVESVIGSLGTQDFVRVRMGIHPGHPIGDGARFVLAPMRRALKEELDELLDFACQAVESIVAEGVERAMAKFNRRARGEGKEEG